MSSARLPSFYDAVYHVVRQIPRGSVFTYGRVAAALGSPRAARAVGYALFHLPEGSDVPWQRVINAAGRISLRGHVGRPLLQVQLLKDEGVPFLDEERVDLPSCLWIGPDEVLRWSGEAVAPAWL